MERNGTDTVFSDPKPVPSRRVSQERFIALLLAVTSLAACGEGTTAPSLGPPRATTITVSPATAGLAAVGTTVQLSAQVLDQNGQVMAGTAVDWASSAATVATVSASGLVTAVANGTATITASAGSAWGGATVTVAQEVGAVEILPAEASLSALGDTLRLTAEALDANGHAMAGAEFSWESGDEAVATVDASGLVTGVAEGVATITASAGEASGSAVVTVMQPVATVEVMPSADTIGLGSTLELTAEGFDENGDAVAGAEFSWESSDVAIATVDASGLVTGVAVGTATITASAGSGQGMAEITVMDLERAALIALYEATDGPNWVNSENWLTDTPLGEWFGIKTNREGRVVELAMSYWDYELRQWISNNVSGPIPPELAELTSLEYVQFFDNRLSGPIPPELGKLTNLRRLDFNSNDLWGSIPAELGNLENLTSLNLGGNGLTGPIPTELGALANLTWMWVWGNELSGPIPAALGDLTDLESLNLNGNDLSGSIPPDVGNLANLSELQLGHNDLTGSIPAELGGLANLERLYLADNDLSGVIPESFLALDGLERFHFDRNTDLCAPGTVDFVTWLEGIEDTSGPHCNESDMEVLNLLYETAGGPDWTESGSWLETPALDDWYGVTANSLGRVTALDLSRNRLVGQLPAKLGELAQMTELRIADNPGLTGRLPFSLTLHSLQTLDYSGTGLCAPAYASFRDWLGTLSSHEGTDACPPLSDREVLEVVFDAMGGADWIDSDNWLSGRALGDWYGVIADNRGRVTGLELTYNNISGPIPPELGSLASLEILRLGGFAPSMKGEIPAELGNLANLRSLALFDTMLEGAIPPEIDNLANLRFLYLAGNQLGGSIPPEIGSLVNLERLSLDRNQLTGPIPDDLANLTSLERLALNANRLTGPMWPALGNLTELERLYVGHNFLEGPVPPEFGNLASLRELDLSGNPDMSGDLPASLINLVALELFSTADTGLCAPTDAGFLEWLEGVPNRRMASCEGEPAMAYPIQPGSCSWDIEKHRPRP